MKSKKIKINLLLVLLFLGGSTLVISSCSSDSSQDTPPKVDGGGTVVIDDPTKPLDALPTERKVRLKKGINLAHWFSQQENNDLGTSYIDSRFVQADFDFLKISGFTYVRFPVDERILLTEPNTLNTVYLEKMDAFIQKIIAMKVGVLFDFHPTQGFKDKVHANPAYADNIKLFWGKLAKHLSKFDPNYLFFEVMNEPSAETAEQWNKVQETWVTTIRANAPKHTIVVDGNLRITKDDWNDVTAVMSIVPLKDKNIVYNLHYYQPFAFTHQGATWGWEVAKYTEGLLYPMNKTNCINIKNKYSSIAAVGWAMDDYIVQNWNKQTLSTKIKPVADWATSKNICVIVNEFGAYYTAQNNGKTQYLKDMREALEANGIGWCVWEYDKGFGIVTKTGSTISFNAGVKDALGF